MVQAYDKKCRSERRKQTETISFRCTKADKALFQSRAKQHGYDSLSEWIKDFMCDPDAYTPRTHRMVCGHLGEIADRVDHIGMFPCAVDVVEEVQSVIAHILWFQRQLMERGDDACEGD